MIETHVFPTRILIVDDNAANRDSLAVALRYTDDSFLVSTAENGAEALERLTIEPFDVVLCDLVLGGDLNGIAVTRAIQSHHDHVRTVVFTGQETGESKEEVLDAGAFLYLSKPVPHKELVHAIRTVNKIRRTERLQTWFEALTEISFELQGSFDFERLSRKIVDGACRLGYSRARLYLVDEERQVLVGTESSGMREEFRFGRYIIPFAESPLIARLFKSDRALFLNKAVIEEKFGFHRDDPWLAELQLDDITWVDCPLVVRGHRIGTLGVDHREQPDYRFTEEDRQILTVFSGLAAQALHNSRLYEQEALANASLESILENAPDAVITTDLDGEINFASPSSERVLGLRESDLEGRKAEDFFTDAEASEGSGVEIASEILSDLRQAKEGVLPNRSVYVGIPGRNPRQCLLSASLLYDDLRQPIGVLGILKDLGPFEDEGRHYQDVLEAFGHGMLVLSQTREISFVNRKAMRLLGRGLVGRDLLELVDPSQVAEVMACLQRLHAREASEEILELHLIEPGGATIEVTATFTRTGSRRGNIVLGISDHRELGLLVQSQRLMMLGEMVPEIAHEINNPLNNILPAIQDARQVVKARGWVDEELEEDFETVAEGGRRIRDIVRQLREFGRSSDFEAVPGSLNKLVEDSMGFFATRLRSRGYEIEANLASDLPDVAVDRKRFLQVLLNLVVNAEQAMEGAAGRKMIEIITQKGPPGFVKLSVADSGPGIPEAVGQTIFQPFFTTKRDRGTGLGLSVSRSIIDLHRGSIYIDNGDHGGAVISIELPVAS